MQIGIPAEVKNLSASRDVASTETNLIFEHIKGTALTGAH